MLQGATALLSDKVKTGIILTLTDTSTEIRMVRRKRQDPLEHLLSLQLVRSLKFRLITNPFEFVIPRNTFESEG